MQELMSLIDIKQTISAVIGGAMAGVIAILTTIINNKGFEKRMHTQILNDRKQKIEDKIHSSKREIYLQFSEELSHMASCVASIMDINRQSTDILDKFSKSLAVSSKAQAVANENSLRNILNISSIALSSFAMMHQYRNELSVLKERMDAHRSIQNDSLEKMKIYNNLMEQINTGKDSSDFEAVFRKFQFYSDSSNTNGQLAERIALKLTEKISVAARELPEFSTKFRSAAVGFMISAREELHDPLDKKIIEAIYTEYEGTISDLIPQAIAKAKEQMEAAQKEFGL
jgi:hypothetical protein